MTSEQHKQLVQMETANQRLFTFGIAQLVIVLLLAMLVWINGERINNFMGDGGPWGRPALQSLDAIKAETPRDVYILSVVRQIIPLPIVAVKNSFIASTLIWLFVTALMLLGFARYQKKQLDNFKAMLTK